MNQQQGIQRWLRAWHRLTCLLTGMLFFVLCSSAGESYARVMNNDPQGFQDIPWGASLEHVPNLALIDTDAQFQTYALRSEPPYFGRIPVESIKLFTIHGKFARALVRYRGQATHEAIMEVLESQFGEVRIARGAMIRGLNQQYTWQGQNTEINLTYQGLRERGIFFVESRVLAPGFLDVLSEHGH